MENRITQTEILLDPKTDDALALIDKRAEKFVHALSIDSPFGRLRRAAILAMAIQELDKALTPMMPLFMALQNSQLGFKTDRAPGNKKNLQPYDMATVKTCLIAALLSGLYPIGNEFNILAGGMYAALEGYRRKVNQIPGLTDLVLAPGTPYPHNGGQAVRVGATWKMNGIPGKLVDGKGEPGLVFQIIANEYSSPDAIVGKAKRKALKVIYEQATGTESTLPDGEADEPGTEVQTETTARADKLAAAMNGAPKVNGTAPPPGASDAPKPNSAAVTSAEQSAKPKKSTVEQRFELDEQIKRAAFQEMLPGHLMRTYKVRSARELTMAQCEEFIAFVKGQPTKAEGESADGLRIHRS